MAVVSLHFGRDMQLSSMCQTVLWYLNRGRSASVDGGAPAACRGANSPSPAPPASASAPAPAPASASVSGSTARGEQRRPTGPGRSRTSRDRMGRGWLLRVHPGSPGGRGRRPEHCPALSSQPPHAGLLVDARLLTPAGLHQHSSLHKDVTHVNHPISIMCERHSRVNFRSHFVYLLYGVFRFRIDENRRTPFSVRMIPTCTMLR